MPVQARGEAELVGDGLVPVLPSAADASVPLGVEARRIETVHQKEAVVQVGGQLAVEADADLVPGGRDEAARVLQGGAIRAEEGGRLVELVDEAHRKEH